MKKLKLFEKYGIELEYMIVNKKTLDILPITDQLFHSVAKKYVNDIERGEYGWSNELVLHVLELKNQFPVSQFGHLGFQTEINAINQLLNPFNAQLLPTGMHPWMNPEKETRLWPHENHEIYKTFDKIFDCKQHGWANLQSCQINLPFSNNDEFVRLHAAIRFLMPIMPALASSSPIKEGKQTHLLNNRLEAYRANCIRVPSITGNVIPEKIESLVHYKKHILETIYHDVSVHDPERTLAYEWLNARGAITRFDRYAIEIRLLDMQENPLADIAILQAIVCLLKKLAAGEILDLKILRNWEDKPLELILKQTIEKTDLATITDNDYLKALGVKGSKKITAGELWQFLIEQTFPKETEDDKKYFQVIQNILKKGTLSRRILKALNHDFSHKNLRAIYQELSDCLAKGTLFRI